MLTQKRKKEAKLKGTLEAFVANTNPYYPNNPKLFVHDEASTPNLGDN